MKTDILQRSALRGGPQLMRHLGRLILVISVIAALIQTLTYAPGYPRVGTYIGFFGGLAMLWLLRHDRHRAAAVIFIALMVIAAPVTALTTSGAFSSSWLIVPLATTAAGWLLGVRAAYALAVIGILELLVVYALHVGGFPFIAPHPLTYALSVVVFSAMGAVIGSVTANSLEKQMNEATTLGDQLQLANADLEERVAQRTQALAETLNRVQATQNELLDSVKRASLGAMVSSVADRLNAPLETALNATTAVQRSMEELNGEHSAATLRRSALLNHLEDASAALAHIERAIDQAAIAVADFKQVAKDQAAQRRRRFDLRTLIDSELASLIPGLRASGLEVHTAVAAGIDCDSFPGALGQIIDALLRDAATTQQTHVRLRVSASVDAADLTFECPSPKPATLTLCQRIAQGVLGGSLHAEPRGDATAIVVRLPRIAPGQNLTDDFEPDDAGRAT